ncbi:hypothetical protein ACFW1A_25295, partial [Kitasatospora sp. NPDC058965]
MKIPLVRLLAGASAATLAIALTALLPGAATAATAVTLYASPAGSGSACSQAAPCSLTGAQAAVRALNPAGTGADVTVDLLDGAYRPSATWKFTAADSGSPGHPVSWQAAPGAHPVISGATRVTGWTQVGSSGVWSAPVPAGSESRQLYVNGREAPVAQASPSALGFTGGWSGSATGYSLGGDAAATAWFAGLTAAQLAGVEFDYPAGNGAWTESRCRVASYGGGTLTMAQPCWTDVTARAAFSQGSGGLPSMNPSTMPALIEDAPALVHPGQWFLDQAGSTLSYQPLPGEQLSSADIELPRLETLLQGAGTLAAPLHDLTFSGLQFSYATWNDPSSPAGFSDVQSNLRITGAHNQGMCTFANPAGSCPWGALTQPLANVDFTATTNLTLTGNRFAELGGAGLGVRYGAHNTLVQGNEFTDIASTGLLLGCTGDPNPTNPDPAVDPDTPAVIKQTCTPDAAAVAGDTIGTNEILTGTTVTGNTVHHVGTDYSSAPGITLLFAQGTTITHNALYDLPYDAITAGVIQGHTDQATTPQNVVNTNQSTTISNNLFHDFMSVRSDGGAVYAEGHQAQYEDAGGNPTSYDKADPTQTLAHGLQVTGNVAYNGHHANFTYYDDAGSEWINWQGNAGIGVPGLASTGGCSQTGHIWTTGNYFSLATVNKAACNAAVDLHAGGNTTIPATPGPDDLPAALLTGAGPTAPSSWSGGAEVAYVSPTSGSNQLLIAGDGFTAATQVYAAGTALAAGSVRALGHGFLVATVPAGTTPDQLWVANRADDTDPAIGYSGFTPSGNRGLGDYGDTVHYATADGATATYTFTGTALQVYGEQYTDQGNLGITLDNGTPQTVNTVPTDGLRHTDVPVYTATGLTPGTHTVTVTKLSGQYATLDGYATAATAPPTLRIDDTAPAIGYSGFTPSGNRGLGDLGDTVHYATANGATATYTFTGTALQVYGEQYTDQGNLGITLD